MKKVIGMLLFNVLFFAVTPEPGLAQGNPCGPRGTRITKSATGGAIVGAIIGGILNGGGGAKKGALIVGVIGAASAIPTPNGCGTQVRAANSKKSSDRGNPFSDHINRADQLETVKDMQTVYVRKLQNGNMEALIGLLGPAFDKNGFSLFDPSGHDTNPDYVVDVAMQQVAQNYNAKQINLWGKNGNITSNPSGGSARFLVTITTYRNGKFDRNLSAVNMPVVSTFDGNSVQVSTRDGSGRTGIQFGSSGTTYTVDPYTVAAYQAIVRIFRLVQ